MKLAQKINALYYDDEFQPIIVYGGANGIGKSSYSIQGLTEALYWNINHDELTEKDYKSWEKVKEFIVFKPVDFIKKCYQLANEEKREKAIIWDDAGFWLNSLEWSDPFLIAVGKYLNVARTNWGSIIFTTPNPLYIIKKIRSMPDRITVKIEKEGSNYKNPSKPRIALAYLGWLAADLKKTGVNSYWKDDFSAIMPNDFFRWYKPLRDKYARMGIKLMIAHLNSLLEKGQLEEDIDELEALKRDMFYEDFTEKEVVELTL